MPFEEQELTAAQSLQGVRRERFAFQAAERIRSAEKCLFSLLPHDELSRMAGDWFDACAQAMLRGNYASIDFWVRTQAERAASQGFAPADLLQMMAICRQAAIDLESWNEDILSSVDEVIEEVFASIHGKIAWKAPEGHAFAIAASEIEPIWVGRDWVPETEESTSERRKFARNRLQLPIRVKSGRNREIQEVTKTHSISRGGLYFITTREYKIDQSLRINFPYWDDHGGINREYDAKVIRLDRLPGQEWGVGVDFQEDLGRNHKDSSSRRKEGQRNSSRSVRRSPTHK
jgi:hypothetical protein